jgi:hypothetical protein
MGSRFQFYYHHNQPGKCFGTTRNGYISNQASKYIIKIYDGLHRRLRRFIEDNNIVMAIFDGELLPWSLLGQNLINHEFLPSATGAINELEFLNQSGFFEQHDKLVDIFKESGFKSDRSKMAAKELNRKYANYRSYKIISKNLNQYSTYSESYKSALKFREQIDIFDKATDVTYKPFSVLKFITVDGTEYIPGVFAGGDYDSKLCRMSQSDLFNLINDSEDDQIIINLEGG